MSLIIGDLRCRACGELFALYTAGGGQSMNSANDVNKGRWMVLAFASVVLLTGFILGRLSASSDLASAETKAASATPTAGVPVSSPVMPGYSTAAAPAGATSPAYPGGLAQTANGFDPAMPPDFRSGYSEGFKQGFSEASTRVTSEPRPRTTNTVVTRRVYYSPAPRPVYYEKKKNSTLKTVLTIAAPAAIGAGVGAAVAGGKGAGAGALIGGGGGALYHLIRNH